MWPNESKEGLTYSTVTTFKGHHPFLAIFNVRRLDHMTYPTVVSFVVQHPTLTIPLWPHQSEQRLTYPAVTSHKAQNPTVNTVTMTGPPYNTVIMLKQGMSELSNCEHFWGFTPHFDRIKMRRVAYLTCGHMEVRTDWPIPLWPFLRLSIQF